MSTRSIGDWTIADPRVQLPRARPRDLIQIGQAERHEQQARLVDVTIVLIDDRDLDAGAPEPVQQAVGRNGPASPRAEDDDGVHTSNIGRDRCGPAGAGPSAPGDTRRGARTLRAWCFYTNHTGPPARVVKPRPRSPDGIRVKRLLAILAGLVCAAIAAVPALGLSLPPISVNNPGYAWAAAPLKDLVAHHGWPSGDTASLGRIATRRELARGLAELLRARGKTPPATPGAPRRHRGQRSGPAGDRVGLDDAPVWRAGCRVRAERRGHHARGRAADRRDLRPDRAAEPALEPAHRGRVTPADPRRVRRRDPRLGLGSAPRLPDQLRLPGDLGRCADAAGRPRRHGRRGDYPARVEARLGGQPRPRSCSRT